MNEATKPMVHAMDQREGKRCYNSLLADLTKTNIPGYQSFARIPPALFDLTEECTQHPIKKEVTNFRKPLRSWLESGNNTETPGNKRNVQVITVSLDSLPNHHM